MKRFLVAIVVLGVMGLAVFYGLTIPGVVTKAELPKHTASIQNGETMFYAGGCASCHAAPASDKCDDHKYSEPTKLVGGRCLKTPFGTFYVPNISPDKEDGIGGWTNAEFVTAMVKGVSPSGSHYYPAFPFTSYQRMKYTDLIDMKAYLDSLPAVKGKAPAHDLALPFKLRRGLGLWKVLFLDGKQFKADPGASDEINRGAYLTEGPGHCGECHSPRNALGGVDTARRFGGGAAPEGGGFIPNITSHKTGIGGWSKDELVEAFTTGFTPSFDSLGGSMTSVWKNLSKLSVEDRKAIAAYLKSLPPVESKKK
ncbi:MAG: c-type cytochrome [Methyloligellaceae bacterium]